MKRMIAVVLMAMLVTLVPASGVSAGPSCRSVTYFQPHGGDDLWTGTYSRPFKTRYRAVSAGSACVIELDEDWDRIGPVLYAPTYSRR